MSVPLSQLPTLKADIAANTNTVLINGVPTAINAVPNNDNNNATIAIWYNGPPNPDFWVWRTSVPQLEIVTTTTADGTVWSWPAFIARSQGERDGWREMFADGGKVNAALPNVRQGFADIFSGSASSAPAQRTHLLTVGRRKATLIEKLFATGTGSTASPAVMGFEGLLQGDDVTAARNS